MGMGHQSRPLRFRSRHGRVRPETGADRSRTHRGAVAIGALTEECGGCDLPGIALLHPHQEGHRASRIAAARLFIKAPDECRRERILIDRAEDLEDLENRERHVGIVGPAPRTWRKTRRPMVQPPGHMVSEGVANGQPIKAVPGAIEIGGDVTQIGGAHIAPWLRHERRRASTTTSKSDSGAGAGTGASPAARWNAADTSGTTAARTGRLDLIRPGR